MTNSRSILPACLAAAARRIRSIDSCLASPMKPQVLMTTVLASVRSLSAATVYPAAASWAMRCSESTVFFEQPRVMTLIFFM